MIPNRELRHIISADDFNHELLDILFKQTDILKHDFHRRFERNHRSTWNRWKKELSDYILITFFYAPSTRTRHTFESAMLRLGGHVISTENAALYSSAVKGERFRHTIKTESFVGDVMALRLTREGFAQKAADVDAIPIINGGDGSEEHPTQALLDLYTIIEKFGERQNLMLTFVGDLLRGRTVKSLARLLANHRGSEFGPVSHINFVGPEQLQIPQDVISYIRHRCITHAQDNQLSKGVLAESDVVYMTRPQSERPKKESEGEMDEKIYEEIDGSLYQLTPELASYMKKDAIIMHPLPANDELPDEIDDDPRAWYFKQVENGVFTRMAILLWIFDRIDITSHELN